MLRQDLPPSLFPTAWVVLASHAELEGAACSTEGWELACGWEGLEPLGLAPLCDWVLAGCVCTPSDWLTCPLCGGGVQTQSSNSTAAELDLPLPRPHSNLSAMQAPCWGQMVSTSVTLAQCLWRAATGAGVSSGCGWDFGDC